MEIASIATLSLGGAGLIGIITWLFTKFVSKDPKIKLLDIFKKKVVEEQEQKKIYKITKEQEIISKQIEIAEMSSETTKQKVKDTIIKASKDIQIILKEDKIAEIDKQIEKDWEEI